MTVCGVGSIHICHIYMAPQNSEMKMGGALFRQLRMQPGKVAPARPARKEAAWMCSSVILALGIRQEHGKFQASLGLQRRLTSVNRLKPTQNQMQMNKRHLQKVALNKKTGASLSVLGCEAKPNPTRYFQN